MSSICGILNLDSEPVEVSLLRRMIEQSTHRGPDGLDVWLEGQIGMATAMLRLTTESVCEKQPFADASRNCITFDGRLDNRKELCLELVSQNYNDIPSDAQLVLMAYKRWEENCLSKLLGDFSFAIWDEFKKQLFCVRDRLGFKPFYYFSDHRRFLFASEKRQLLEYPDVPARLNEGMIAEYLAAAISSEEETLHESIRRLPPAHYLTVGRSFFRIKKYWDIDNVRKISYRNDQEYVDDFYSILEEAVFCRLRSHTAVGALLSGGIDSSAVVTIVDSLRKKGMFDRSFETFSLVFPGLPCDETEYIQKISEKTKFKNLPDLLAEPTFEWYEDNAIRHRDFPYYPNGTMHNPQRALAINRGIRVLLTGFGGDDWLTGEPQGFSEFWNRFQLIVSRLSRLKNDWLLLHEIPTLKQILSACFSPILPFPIKNFLNSRLKSGIHANTPEWIDRQFAEKVGLAERTQNRQHSILPASVIHSHEIDERSASEFGLEQRHPFHDKRLIEFVLGIPARLLWNNGYSKSILRKSMSERLPREILVRTDKPGFSHLYVHILRTPEVRQLIRELPMLSSFAWIGTKKIHEMYNSMETLYMTQDQSYYRYTWPLWMVLGIELFLQSEFHPKVSGKSNQMAWKVERKLYEDA